MKTTFLSRDLLMQPDACRPLATQSQKENWLRLMERERSSQFVSISAADNRKMDNLSQSFAGVRENQRAFASGSTRVNEALSLPTAPLREDSLPIVRSSSAREKHEGNNVNFPALSRGAYPQRNASEGVSVGASFLERLLRQRWPRANVVIAKGDDGVRIWLRDPDLLKDGSAINSLVAQIKKALASQGISLAELTVNGETVFCNQEG